MTRGRLFAWIAALLLLLTGVLVYSVLQPPGTSDREADGDMVVDKLLGRLGVTRQEAVLRWLVQDGADENPDNPTVWIANNGKHFHGYPLCSRLGSPKETTYWYAKAMGYRPCPVCCAGLWEEELYDAD